MSDNTLQLGAQRLGANLAGAPCNEESETSWNAAEIAADPGIRALLTYVLEDIGQGEDRGREIEARAALKLWEHGNA